MGPGSAWTEIPAAQVCFSRKVHSDWRLGRALSEYGGIGTEMPRAIKKVQCRDRNMALGVFKEVFRVQLRLGSTGREGPLGWTWSLPLQAV